jgi:exodeoxyribonuclease V alpha subunit
MKTEPKPPDWEVLAGMVEHVTYQNAENGFTVVRAKARGHRELSLWLVAAVSAGEWITATGVEEWKPSSSTRSGAENRS